MSKIKEEEEVSAMAAALTLSTAPQKRNPYILAGEIRQTFSFPDTIMHYIAMNPSTPKVYQKSIQCCKYFFNKNPILVIDELLYADTGEDTGVFEWKVMLKKMDIGIKLSDSDESDSEKTDTDDSEKIDSDESDSTASDESDSENTDSDESNSETNESEAESESEKSDTIKSNVYKAEKIDMDAVTCKFWVTNFVSVMPWNGYHPRVATSIIPKIYQCDASNISLTYQAITLNDFLLLVSNAKYFNDFYCVTITESDGKTEVPFEKVIEKCPNIRYIRWGADFLPSDYPCQSFSSDTVKELIKLPNFAQITYLSLSRLPEVINPKELFDYVKNKNKNMSLYLRYDVYEYSDETKQQINDIVDEVLSIQTFTYKPPLMYYWGMDWKKYDKMAEIHNRYRNTRF